MSSLLVEYNTDAPELSKWCSDLEQVKEFCDEAGRHRHVYIAAFRTDSFGFALQLRAVKKVKA